ncbi:MAG: hypothetical protein WAL50_16215 [Kineosporiaceae bacterium]|jgi:hypothetical protein
MTEYYWLLDWMDDQGIGEGDVAKLLSADAGRRRSIVEAASEAAARPLFELTNTGNSLVAGMGFDLSGRHACGSLGCLRRQLDDLVSRSLLLFDEVVAVGLDPNLLAAANAAVLHDGTLRQIVTHVELARYARATGASEFLVFDRRPTVCTQHLEEHAREAGLSGFAAAETHLTELLRDGYVFRTLEAVGDHWHVAVSHPALPYTTVRDVPKKARESKARAEARIRMETASTTARVIVSTIIRDGIHANRYKATLGQAVSYIPGEVYPHRAGIGEAALQLNLPVVGIDSVRETLRAREASYDQFEVFRASAREMLSRYINAASMTDAGEVAYEVVDREIVPSMARIENRMNRAKDLLKRRSALSLGIGVATTTVGLLAFTPLVLPGALLATGVAMSSLGEYLKDKRDIELSDMYFLWNLSRNVNNHV